MEKTQILQMSAVELGRAIREGRTTAVEATEAVLEQIEKTEEQYNCYITVAGERALEQAAQVQGKIESGELTGPLAGVPAAVKDNMCTEGIPTTCASRMLEGFVPGYTCEAVRRLEQAGVILIGKTNMDEFAMGSTTETSAFGVTRNPRNPRQPASHCGVVGMKPTYGMVSRYGLVAYGSSLDQIGPLGKTVEDCAAVLELIAAHDEKDSTSLCRQDVDFTAALKRDVEGMRIGIPRDYFGEGLEEEVAAAVRSAAEELRTCGAVVEEFDLSLVEYAIPAYYTIAAAEASSNLERFDGVKYGYRAKDAEGLHQMYRRSRSEGFGPEVKRRIMLGSFVLSSGYYDAYYLKALKVKALIKKAFDSAFARYDCVLGPVAPTTAPRLGESLTDPLRMYLGDIYTISVNLAGLPGISLPCGTDSRGLPIGLQLIGDCFAEKKLLQAAYTFEQSREG